MPEAKREAVGWRGFFTSITARKHTEQDLCSPESFAVYSVDSTLIKITIKKRTNSMASIAHGVATRVPAYIVRLENGKERSAGRALACHVRVMLQLGDTVGQWRGDMDEIHRVNDGKQQQAWMKAQ